MSNGLPQSDPRWPRLLSLAVHEFRTPVTVVSGYIRMLLKDKTGALTDQHRRLLEEAEKSCGRLSGLLVEMSDLANVEGGNAPLSRSTIDLGALLEDTIASLPPLPDRHIDVALEGQASGAMVEGDPGRLKAAATAVLTALRREVVGGDGLLVRQGLRQHDQVPSIWVAVADASRVARLSDADVSQLTLFDEWRGGCGLSLAIARRVIEAHGGRIWSPAEDSKAGAVIVLPQAP
ncbi:MAG: HAMP domain-containing histidine kinase [Chloroflexi bacterium]|nr:HAMP domain-containing histidine kinase [Chloroflexota bacterium]